MNNEISKIALFVKRNLWNKYIPIKSMFFKLYFSYFDKERKNIYALRYRNKKVYLRVYI